MNLPNRLTLARLLLAGVFVAVLSLPIPGRHSIGLVVFGVAAITDFLDGHIARSRGLVTSFGKLMDPLADKVLMAAAFVLLAERGLIPGWAVVVILAREFLVTGLRLVATSQGAVLAADSLGKQKTILQIVTALYFLLLPASGEAAFAWIRPVVEWGPMRPEWFGNGCLALAVLATLVSGVGYLVRNRGLLADA